MPIIGREAPADIVVPLPQVSARHADIRSIGDGWYELVDLGSTNGTFVDGRRVTNARVRLTERIMLGSQFVDLRPYAVVIGGPAMARPAPVSPAPVAAVPPAVAPAAPHPVASGPPPVAVRRGGGVGAGIAWMFLMSILLFWLPVVGPFLAGLVGGKKAGGVGAALGAALLPAVLISVFIFGVASTLTGIPLLGALLGMGALALCLAHAVPLLLGALIGGLIA
jgi:hypothetical protein